MNSFFKMASLMYQMSELFDGQLTMDDQKAICR